MSDAADGPGWDRVWEVFHQALATPTPERALVVERLCAGDAELTLLSTVGEVYGNLGLHSRSAAMLEQVVEQRRRQPGDLELAGALHDLDAASSRARW